MHKLKKIYLNGYKSFRNDAVPIRADIAVDEKVHRGNAIEFGDITVLLGANGAGKSNLLSFFHMLNFMIADPLLKPLEGYVGREGGANSILHYGETTIHAEVEFVSGGQRICYIMDLGSAKPDALVFNNESIVTGPDEGGLLNDGPALGAGHKESRLRECANHGDPSCKAVIDMLSGCRVYQFSDTSSTASVRKSGYIEDAAFLQGDAGNLAAYLRGIRVSAPRYYQRIIDHIRMAFPQFGDFVLEPSALNANYILLNWREAKRPAYPFGPHQLSDGTLRFMALAALFLQPKEKLPPVIVIDEPELGLHPYAIVVLASMIRTASANCQVILSTQSTRLVDEFDVGEIVVVNRDEQSGATRCHRPDAGALDEWIQRYTTSELWEKNVLGGRQ
jgi:predicted ATPase